MKDIRKKTALIGACLVLMVLLTGCGGSNEYITQGMQAIKSMDYREALTYFEQARLNDENKRLVERGKGIAFMGLTDYEQAAACFEEALALSGGLVESLDYDLNYYLAAAYTKSGRYQEAETVYDAILGLRPQEADAFFLRGNVRLSLDKDARAQEDFERAMALEPQNYDRYIQIYEVLEYHGLQESGRFYLQTALQNGEDKMGAYDKGRIYYYLGEYQKAYLELEDAKEKGGAEAYLYLGRAYEATGDYNYASSVYNAYLNNNPNDAQLYNQLGLCEMNKGEYQKALEAFQAGLQIEDSGFLQTLTYNEIVAYEFLGEYNKAAVLMAGYLATYPDDENARREADFLNTR